MRLLHFDELGKLILTDFDGKTTPPYAILSHRWNDSEILIQDIANGDYKQREDGLRKLEFCTKQAAQDGLEYFWIDTCCIDKWNIHELSRAINLMFQWYKNAAQCYVFLSDVSTETPQCNNWEVLFRASAWFTRGWTLQELIAPASVNFFSYEGQCIGDKISLGELIYDITNIPVAALRDYSLGDFTTLERMRWVESRRTKEEEDIVYCLLGILGVSMPIVYGEGRDIAQRRLQAELEAVGKAPSIIPFSQNPGFIGRDLQLAEVEAKLFSSEQTSTTLAIVGLGGTGKSQLALEVAHRTRQKIKNCSVFWIDASDKDRLYQSYASVAQKLNVAGWDDDHVDMERVIQGCVAELSAQQCLLIFDNAEETTLQSGGSSNTGTVDLAECLPQSKLCSAIFTTTNVNAAEVLASQNIIKLQELAPDRALKMLAERLARPLSNVELREAEHLLKELLYLPLAIFQAAACMNASNMTVQEYRSQLHKLNKSATGRSDNSSESKPQDSHERNPVAATLALSIDQISRNNKLAADYLFLAACVDQKDIPLDLFEAASTHSRENAVKVLERYALVTRRPADSAFDIHRLVHHALRKWLEVQGRLRGWTKRTIAQLDRVYPSDDYSNRSMWRRLFPHAQYALSHGPTTDLKKRLSLLWKYTATLYEDGRYKEYEELEMQGLQISKEVYGEEHHDTLIAKSNLALAYTRQERSNEAEELQVQVVQSYKRMLGDKHPDTLTSMNNLLSIYLDQERDNEAEELAIQVLQGRKEVYGDEHPDTFESMSDLGWVYRIKGRWTEARELHMQVMQGRKRLLGDDHPKTLSSMYSVAVAWYSLGRHEEAFALLEKCLQLQQRILGIQHPETQSTLELLNEWRA